MGSSMQAIRREPKRIDLMEKLVLSLCGLWFWLTRKYRATQYREAAEWLTSAYNSLEADLYSRWSTRDRGYILPFQAEALSILELHSRSTVQTANRFESLLECCRFIAEELAGVPKARPRRPRTEPALQPAFVRAAASTGNFRSLWNAKGSGAAGHGVPLLQFRLKPEIADAELPGSRAA